MRKIIHIILAALLPLCVSCHKEKQPETQDKLPPRVLSTSPVNGETGLEGPSVVVSVIFDKPVEVVSQEISKVSAGDAAVKSVRAYADTAKVALSGLVEGNTYTLRVPEGVFVSRSGVAAPEIAVTFSMVEPEFHYEYKPTSILVNANITPEAYVAYAYLKQISGRKMLLGSHNIRNTNAFMDFIYMKVKAVPAIVTYDFSHVYLSPTPQNHPISCDYSNISLIKEHWNKNGLVSFVWDWAVPATEADWHSAVENYRFDKYTSKASDTYFSVSHAIVSGTWENEFLMADLDEVASYLQILQENGIPVIWNPLHSAAGNYTEAEYWWGEEGPQVYKSLWRYVYNYLTNECHLNNLIWVWSTDYIEGCQQQMRQWYPGDDCVDIIGANVFAEDTSPQTDAFHAMVDMTEGKKMVTISECGNLPLPSSWIAAGNKWAYFQACVGYDNERNLSLPTDLWPLNTVQYWSQVVADPLVVLRDDMPDLKKSAKMYRSGSPIENIFKTNK